MSTINDDDKLAMIRAVTYDVDYAGALKCTDSITIDVANICIHRGVHYLFTSHLRFIDWCVSLRRDYGGRSDLNDAINIACNSILYFQRAANVSAASEKITIGTTKRR